MTSPPMIPGDLLDYLRERYPDRCPDLDLSDREFGAYFGARQLIRHLEGIYAEQNDSGDDEQPDQPIPAIYRVTRAVRR